MVEDMFDEEYTWTRQLVVRQEIETAIHLLLTNGSLASAHLLASAANEILKAVATERGIETITSGMDKMIRPEKRSEFFKLYKKHYNYIKHADKDPNDILWFVPKIVFMTSFQSAVDYETVFGKITIPMRLFTSWMGLHNREIFFDTYQPIIDRTSQLFRGDHSLTKCQSIYQSYLENRSALNTLLLQIGGDRIEI